MELYNLEKLIKIRVFDKHESTWYHYYPCKKSWWSGILKEGIYSHVGKYHGLHADDHFVEDGKVYKYPKCVLLFENDIIRTYSFRNKEDAVTKDFKIDRLFFERTGNHLIEL